MSVLTGHVFKGQFSQKDCNIFTQVTLIKKHLLIKNKNKSYLCSNNNNYKRPVQIV